MGTDLDSTLAELVSFKNQVDYWLECIGEKEDTVVKSLLDQVELRLRVLNERKAGVRDE